MKKQYQQPTITKVKIDNSISLQMQSDDNGLHKGWDNPNNPHYDNPFKNEE